MSTSGGYHEYIGGCSVHRGYIVMHVGDTMSTLGVFSTSGGYHEYIGGDTMSTSGGYHEYIQGCSVHRRMFSTLGFSIEIERFLPTCSPTCIMISPNVLNIP